MKSSSGEVLNDGPQMHPYSLRTQLSHTRIFSGWISLWCRSICSTQRARRIRKLVPGYKNRSRWSEFIITLWRKFLYMNALREIWVSTLFRIIQSLYSKAAQSRVCSANKTERNSVESISPQQPNTPFLIQQSLIQNSALIVYLPCFTIINAHQIYDIICNSTHS